MLIWTHRHDLLAKLAGVLTLALLFGNLPELARHLVFVGPRLVPVAFAFVVVAGVGGAIVLWFRVVRPTSTWAYVRWTLATPLSWTDARALAPLFEASLLNLGTWYPCVDVSATALESRLPTLQLRAAQLAESRARTAAAIERVGMRGRVTPAAFRVYRNVALAGAPVVAAFAYAYRDFVLTFTSTRDPGLTAVGIAVVAWVVSCALITLLVGRPPTT
jgi:hypothetical protein